MSMGSPTQVARALQRGVFLRVAAAAAVSSGVSGYVFAQFNGLEGGQMVRALEAFAPVLLGALVVQYLIIGWMVRSAMAEPPAAAPAQRLHRLLRLPRQVEVFYVEVWAAGSVAYAVTFRYWAHGTWGQALSNVPSAILASLLPGILMVLSIEELLRPVALEEFIPEPGRAIGPRGFFWTRQRVYLPYAFAVALVSVVCLTGMIVYAQFTRAIAHVGDPLVEEGLSAATPFVQVHLYRTAGHMALPVALLLLLFVVAFAAAGLAMARRQARAAAEVESALGSMAGGDPQLPRWVATDEIGDLSAATACIAQELQSVFTQIRAMARGDLGRALEGQGALLDAFRESREGMLELSRRMTALSRGEAVEAERIAGDLGAAFARLQAAFNAIVEQARVISEGDLREDVELPGALGDAMQRMTTNLRSVVGRTQAVSGSVGGIVVSLQTAAAQLSAATNEQVAAVTETANTMTEMAQTSAVSADRAGELIRQGDSAAAVVEEGSAAAEVAVSAMSAISGSLSKVSQASGALAERAQKIDSITETVSFLADQSSTLAINAAIEAARAGDAGKGFAVVAREIRALASDSRKAASQIREVLGEIRDRTAQVDGSVGEGSRTVDDGVRLVQRLGEVVAQLGVTVNDSVSLMRQVEGSARQHQAGVAQVSQALTNMQRAAESIRDGAQQLGALSAQARDLSTLLQEAAGTYTLPAAERKGVAA